MRVMNIALLQGSLLNPAASRCSLHSSVCQQKPFKPANRRQDERLSRIRAQADNNSDSSDGSKEPRNQKEGIPDSLPASQADTDWREFRARLIASQNASSSVKSGTQQAGNQEAGQEEEPGEDKSTLWAHSLNFPEKGCLLVAHPLMFTTQQMYFSQAVIFIFEHSEQGSAGLILNRPTQYTIGGMPGLETLGPEFGDNVLFLGGDVSPNSMHMLHTQRSLPESVEVIRGICMGGFDTAKAAVAQGRASAQDFKWFTRYSGWGPGQLQRECASGVWFTAAASSAFILQQGEQDRGASGREMWHQILELMGGEHAGISEAAKGLHNIEITGPTNPSENRDSD